MASKARELANLGNAYSDGALSNRNLIINGAMQVWQRGTSRTYKQHDYGTVDRFQPGRYQEAAYERVAVSGSGPDAQYALRVSSSNTSEAASGTRMAVGQMIESVNCQQLKGRQVTLSFWIKFSNATFTGYGDFRYEIYEYTDVDPAFGTTTTNTTSESFVTNGSLPTSWTKYTKTITVDSTTNTIAVRMGTDSLGNTTNNSDLYYDITEVQLEVGDTATPFEHRSYGQELALCQRYYQRQLPVKGGAGVVSTGRSRVNRIKCPFVCTMRASPSITVIGTPNFYDGGSITSFDHFDQIWSTPDVLEFDADLTGLLTADGRAVISYNDTASGFGTLSNSGFVFDAEL